MGKKHRKIKKYSETYQHASLLFIARVLKDTLKDNAAVYFVSMDNQQILLNTDLTTIFDSLAFSIAYETKDGLLVVHCYYRSCCNIRQGSY